MALVIDIKKELEEVITPLYKKIEELEKQLKEKNPVLVNRQKIAQILDVKVETIDKWDRENILPHHIKIGGKKYWDLNKITLK